MSCDCCHTGHAWSALPNWAAKVTKYSQLICKFSTFCARCNKCSYTLVRLLQSANMSCDRCHTGHAWSASTYRPQNVNDFLSPSLSPFVTVKNQLISFLLSVFWGEMLRFLPAAKPRRSIGRLSSPSSPPADFVPFVCILGTPCPSPIQCGRHLSMALTRWPYSIRLAQKIA